MGRLEKQFKKLAGGGVKLGFDPRGQIEGQFAIVPIDEVEPDPDQPRRDLGDLTTLSASIAQEGVLQPLIVTPVAEGRYRIIAGGRRYAAAREAGLTSLPVVIRTVEEQRRLAIQIVENLQRKDLNPVEEARAYRRLSEEFNLSQRDLAERVGKSAAGINQTLRVLTLPEEVLSEVPHFPVSQSVLLEIAKLPDPPAQVDAWNQAKRGELTVARARTSRRDPATPRKPRSWRYVDRMGEVELVVSFPGGHAVPSDRVAEALEAFLSRLREG